MDEGLDHDDKYRMVEDEFLTVAQKWTVHLHAAEYKRQEKMVKARNAETINSISRPVTDRMPDSTRRRVEGMEKSEKQRAAFRKLLATKSNGVDTDSDEESHPWANTSLHGFMASPGKKAALLSKVRSAKAATRAAAGFHKPAQTKAPFTKRELSDSPPSKNDQQLSRAMNQSNISTASEDEDDDLNAPIPAPKLQPIDRTRTNITSLSGSRIVTSSTPGQISESKQRSTSIPTVSTMEKPQSEPSFPAFEPPHAVSDSSGWRAKKFEKSRQAREEQEKQERRKKKVDIIPGFM